MVYWDIFLLGVTFSSTACIASCGPLILSYNIGTNKNTSRGFLSYSLFSFARIAVYLILSCLVFMAGKLITRDIEPVFFKYIYLSGGFFIVTVSVLLAIGKNIKFNFCNYWYNKLFFKDNKNIIILGIIMGLLPCAPLLAFFSYAALVSKTLLECFILTFIFGLGTFFSPLLLLVLFAGLIPKFILKFSPFYGIILRVISASVLFILGMQLIWRYWNA